MHGSAYFFCALFNSFNYHRVSSSSQQRWGFALITEKPHPFISSYLFYLIHLVQSFHTCMLSRCLLFKNLYYPGFRNQLSIKIAYRYLDVIGFCTLCVDFNCQLSFILCNRCSVYFRGAPVNRTDLTVL